MPSRPARRPSLALALSRLRRTRVPAPGLAQVAEAGLPCKASLLLLLVAGLAGVVPIPGLPIGIVFGSLGLAVATPLVLGLTRALPRRLAERPLPQAVVRRIVRFGVPLLRRIERRLRPRCTALVRGLGARLAYVSAAVSALVVTLPIPFGNTLSGIAIILLVLGLHAQDGLVALAGHVFAAAGVAWNTALVTGGLLAVAALV